MKLLAKVIFVTLVAGTGGALLYADSKDPQLLTEASNIKVSIDADHQTVLQLQAKAKQDKDLIRLNCINDKLVILNGQMNIADALFGQVKDGETGVIGDLRTKASDIHKTTEDAKGCVDAKRLSTEASNSFSTNGYIPPVSSDDGDDHDLENPGYASPDD